MRLTRRFIPWLGATGASVAPFVDNGRVLRIVGPRKPDGSPIRGEWLERNFGIHTRSLDLEFVDGKAYKRPRAEGGRFDGDFAIAAARQALARDDVGGVEVDMLVHVSPTPDTLHFSNHLAHIVEGLGLRADAPLVHLDLGCAGLATAFQLAYNHIRGADEPRTVLVVASQCVSSYLGDPELIAPELEHTNPWTWLGLTVFGDGAGAVLVHSGAAGPERGAVLDLWQQTRPDVRSIEFTLGGNLEPVRRATASVAVNISDPDAVDRHFSATMQTMLKMLERRWPVTVEPTIARPFAAEHVKRWYFHQANKVQISRAAAAMGIPLERVGFNVDHLGNTSAASTLLLFDAERRAGRVAPGDLVVFMWIGAGAGAQYGYAVVVV